MSLTTKKSIMSLSVYSRPPRCLCCHLSWWSHTGPCGIFFCPSCKVLHTCWHFMPCSFCPVQGTFPVRWGCLRAHISNCHMQTFLPHPHLAGHRASQRSCCFPWMAAKAWKLARGKGSRLGKPCFPIIMQPSTSSVYVQNLFRMFF